MNTAAGQWNYGPFPEGKEADVLCECEGNLYIAAYLRPYGLAEYEESYISMTVGNDTPAIVRWAFINTAPKSDEGAAR